MTERTALAQRLWDLKTGSGMSLSKMIAPAGKHLSVSTLHAVMHGKTHELEPDTVNGLALILNIPPGHVLALLDDREISIEELRNEEKERLWAMYQDIPRQCQQDVLDLLAVLQRNHSLSARAGRQAERRHKEAAASARLITSLDDPSLDKGKGQPVNPADYGIQGAAVPLPDDQAGDSPRPEKEKQRGTR